MKLKLSKLNAADLLAAAQGKYELDMTDDMLKAMGMDEEAQRLNILTKSEVGDSRVNEMFTAIKAGIDAIVAALSASDVKSVAAIAAAAAPLQPTGDIAKLIADLKAEVANAVAASTKATEQLITATATIEAMKPPAASGQPVTPAPTSGKITPEMIAFYQQQQAALTGSKSDGNALFPLDSVQD